MSHSDQEDDEQSPELISFIRRQINILSQEELIKRKEAIANIYDRLVKEKFSISGMISQQIMLKFDKALLKAFSDPSEKIRETAIKILEELLGRCDDMTPFLPYILSVLYERTNCHDLEGILNLPEVMRPPPSQKPHALVKLVESSEEVRIKLCELLSVIIACNNENLLRNFLDEIVNILRALAMDPCPEVQKAACQNISQFARNNREILLHFSESLARALLLSLVSKKAKVRIAGIEALGQILYCGCWKYNSSIFELLVGYRDPNYVPIKDFYEASHKINYFALLINDPRVAVRDMFIRSLGDWIANLPDKFDHHPRMLPYILSGLFDYYEEIRDVAYETIEECGKDLEKEREKEFREQKQYGIDAVWTQGGKLVNLPLPPPFKKRPCFGARVFVRSHVRKFWHALYKEIKETNIESRKKASSLFLVSVVYVEEWLTQFLYEVIPNLIVAIVPQEKEDIPVAEAVSKIFQLIGRFCDFESYYPIITSLLKGEYSMNPESLRLAIKAFNELLKGSLEATVPNSGLGKKLDHLKCILDFVGQREYLDSISSYNANEAEELLLTLLSFLGKLIKGQEADSIMKTYLISIMKNETIIGYVKNIERRLLTVKVMDLNSSSELISSLRESKPSAELRRLLGEFSQEEILESSIAKIDEEAFKQKDGISDSGWEWKYLYTKLLLRLSQNSVNKNIIQTLQFFVESTNAARTPESIAAISKLSNTLLSVLYFTKEGDWIIKDVEGLAPFFHELLALEASVARWFHETSKKTNPEFIDHFFKNVQVFITKFLDVDPAAEQQAALKRALSAKSSMHKSMARLIKFLLDGFAREYSSKKMPIIQMLLLIMKALSDWARCLSKKGENPGLSLVCEGQYVLPSLFEFCSDRLQSIAEIPQTQRNILFELFDLVLDYIPETENSIFFGEASILADYNKYLSSLIRDFIDEKDFEARQQLKTYLVKLCKRTRLNFKIEIEAADHNKQFGRLAGLREVVQESFNEL